MVGVVKKRRLLEVIVALVLSFFTVMMLGACGGSAEKTVKDYITDAAESSAFAHYGLAYGVYPQVYVSSVKSTGDHGWNRREYYDVDGKITCYSDGSYYSAYFSMTYCIYDGDIDSPSLVSSDYGVPRR